MHGYRVGFKVHAEGAKTKAAIGQYGHSKYPNSLAFEARNHKHAQEVLQESILPGDPRPIRGRADIRRYANLNQGVEVPVV